MPLCPFITRRWRNTQAIKIIVCVLLVLFLISCVRLYHSESEPVDYDTSEPKSASTHDLSHTDTETSKPSQITKVQTTDGTQPSQTLNPISSLVSNTDDETDSVLELRKTIAQLNEMEKVFNAESFTDLSSTEELVIVVQVHNRIGYLRQVIESFKRARDVDKIFLIFSHDYYSKPINDLIKTISFCKVSIYFFKLLYLYNYSRFYKYSTLFQSNCTQTLSLVNLRTIVQRKFLNKSTIFTNNFLNAFEILHRAIQIGCNNALTPDKYSNYREAKYTAVKHHWWWKVR